VARGLARAFDLASALIGCAAAVALFRYKRGVIQAVLGCGLLGIAWTLGRPLLG
jgi:chromate transporter